MDKSEILKRVDHTILTQTCTWGEVKEICDDAIRYNTASICIPPSFVKRAKEYVQDKMKVCTVIGFPNGYVASDVKIYETTIAIKDGADEIDMVINLGNVKSGKFKEILEEIKHIKSICGSRILKVIVETCYLTEAEKIEMCRVVTEAGADYIKTSTGFGSCGATYEDVALFKKHLGSNVKIKAAGGIKNFEMAEEYIRLGADRLGTSSLVKLIKRG
ncbi:MAG: deoxyribose-phosphate aldolase [Clostridium sp.]|nr:deoxyribose-phosphate aldolase [Clostridium sp.]MDY3829091.1 deoxyribose-phosphate aldolase [Clostridium sp.]